MSAVDDRTRDAQARATNPFGSAWVSANAGAGKTYVLSRRVIRLLIAGVDPARILCLTFTRAAAAEMAKRVFGELGRWTALTDAELAAEIASLEGAAPSAETVAAARRLFARALDTPGGLKIQTIHAFCERLLHQFPFEANVAGHFTVLDERDERALAAEARRAVLARAAAEPDGALGRALGTVLALSSDRVHTDSVAEFVGRRDRVGAWIVRNGNLSGAIADLRELLGAEPGETPEILRAEVIVEGAFAAAEAHRLLDLLAGADSKNDNAAAERLAPYVYSDDPEIRIDAWLSLFMKGNGEFRKVDSLVTKKSKAKWPGLDDRLAREQERLQALVDRIRTAEVFESTVAMLRLVDAAIAEYDRLKKARGVLDFEDLVVRTVSLLARSDASAWVHYKLDRGLDHILVDEAQDTSPRQWQVVRRLAAEFFAGEGAGDAIRTLFAVGDEKQSIFSFQGAVPAWFSAVREEIGAAARAGLYAWDTPQLHLSFRSAPVVLEAVDRVFSREIAYTGLAATPEPTQHDAFRRNEPGRVILWPLIEKPDAPQAENWTDPVDHLGVDSPEVTLARRISGTVKGWLDGKAVLDAPDRDGKPRPIRPGGILVLVRSRGALTDAIIRELKTRGVPIAGADRLTLTEHIAVMDLMALGRVVLLPEDDLSLAALLKSPLVGLDEDALYELAHDRKGALWDALWSRAAEREDFARARTLIEGWRKEADWRDPHGFFARILGSGRGREAFYRRLGREAEDVLDEFLAQALAYERTNVASLEGFLAWLVDGDAEIKRDTDILRDEVRVMTVHGAKGLEADVVFLVDNGTMPHAGLHDPRLLPLRIDDDPDDPGPLVWMRSVRQMPERVRAVLDAWRQKSEEEYRRLLYVGMTRARDRLIVCGISKRKLSEEKDCRWHKLVCDALDAECTPANEENGAESREWRAAARAALPSAEPPPAEAAVELPPWAKADAPPSATSLRHITPSAIGAGEAEDDEELAFRPARSSFAAMTGGPATRALDRGRLIHRLLESLPTIAPDRRAAVGARYLEAFAKDWSEDERAALLAEVTAVMAEPAFAAAFAPGSRAEVEIAGRIALASGPATVSGRIDRLAVSDRDILIVDYKTNSPPPAEPPAAYVAQLAAYRALLNRIYPGKNVAAAILWTDGPSLVPISADMLNRAESDLSAG